MRTLIKVFIILLSFAWKAHSENIFIEHGFASVPGLIDIGGGSGSGVLITYSNRLFFCTAKHVLFSEDGKLRADSASISFCSVERTNKQQINYKIDLKNLAGNGLILSSSNHDVVVVRLGYRKPQVNGSVDEIFANFVSVTSSVGPVSFRESEWDEFDDIEEGEDILLFGFPNSIGMQAAPGFDQSRPLLRKGIIAGINPKDRTIILDSPVYFGNSGGPVLIHHKGNPEYYHLAGIVTQMIPFEDYFESKRFHYMNATVSNSGLSVMEPMDFVYDLCANDKGPK